jgi:asparagine synthase (glutamine-hydrolysing)
VCGIAGFSPLDPTAPPPPGADAVLRAMRDTLVPRGPDQGGQALVHGTGLAARRLSIIDVAGSDQPMATPGGRTTVVYNGEVYNFAELRRELQGRGRRLTRSGDTETIPHLVEEFGIEGCLRRLRGMFAFAVYDRQRRELILARDRMGIKPLYWGVFDGVLLFGSEAKACLQHPAFRRDLDRDALAQYLMLEYVPAPRSIYTGLHKLPPAHYLVLRDGEVTVRRYWHPPSVDVNPRSDAAWIEELDGLLASAVEEELVSEVPLGSLLSGGIDSSTVTWYVTQARERPRTFSIRFDEPSFDESPHFRMVARRLETDHVEWQVNAGRLDELLTDVLGFLDEPLADSSLLPVFALSRLVREAGTTVVLSGDGGDELFAGYPTYLAHQLAEASRPVGQTLAAPARALAGLLPTNYDNVSLDYQVKRFLAGLPYGLPGRAAVWMGAFLPDEVREVTGREVPDSLLFDAHERHVADMPGADAVTAAQYLDLRTYMVDSVLTKVDRASMACSVEVRVPMLDHRIAELAFRMPASVRRRWLWGKIPLRELMERRLPRQVLWRGKKGFGAPVASWMRGAGRDQMMDTLGSGAIADLVDQTVVDRLIAEHLGGRADNRRRLWALTVLAGWSQGSYGPGKEGIV